MCGEQPAIGEACVGSGLIGFAETDHAFRSSDRVCLGKNGLKLTPRLLDGDDKRLRLRVRAKHVYGALVCHRDDKLDLGFSLPCREDRAQSLPSRSSLGRGCRDLKATQAEWVGTEVDLVQM